MSEGDGGCLLWQGSTQTTGYGQMSVGRENWLAHRLAWVLEHGEIGDGLHLDHRCGVKRCVNVAHLTPMTPGDHTRRHTEEIAACPKGHPYDEENTYRDKRGRRSCKACQREAVARHRARRGVDVGLLSTGRCLGCGGEIDAQTPGCSTCSVRMSARARRQREATGSVR